MAFQTLRVRLIGVAPLLFHNGRLADPMNPWSKKLKELTGKKDKTDADHAEIARVEWYGGMYEDENGHPCIPGEVIEAAIVSGAKKSKKGPAAKAGVYCEGNWKLMNGGADLSDLKKLWESGKFHLTKGVSIGQSTTMRTRPFFKLPWSVECEVTYDDGLLNEQDVLRFLNSGVSIGDWVPKFGRLKAEKVS